jgi:hypothetical protein
LVQSDFPEQWQSFMYQSHKFDNHENKEMFMQFFQTCSRHLALFLLSASFWGASESFVYSQSSTNDTTLRSAFDSSGNIAAVWVTNAGGSNGVLSGVISSVGDFPSAVTSPQTLSGNYAVFGTNGAVGSSVIATVSAPMSGGVDAAAAYLAFDPETYYVVVLVSTATIEGWNTQPTRLSLDNGNEAPNADVGIVLSPDGQTITVTWSSYRIDLGYAQLNTAISTDGGISFTTTTF